MSEFTIGYDAESIGDLADIWTVARDRTAVTRADHEAARRLAADPLGVGEEHAEGLYLLVVPPLAIYYGVDEVRRHVQVISYGTVA